MSLAGTSLAPGDTGTSRKLARVVPLEPESKALQLCLVGEMEMPDPPLDRPFQHGRDQQAGCSLAASRRSFLVPGKSRELARGVPLESEFKALQLSLSGEMDLPISLVDGCPQGRDSRMLHPGERMSRHHVWVTVRLGFLSSTTLISWRE